MSVTASGTDPLVEHLLTHAVRRGDFVLKSGQRSTWFIDGKRSVCRPDGLLLVADELLAALPEDVVALGGLTMGADPVAFGVAGVAATRGRALRSFSVRKEAKDHGGGGRIAGVLDAGDKVVVVEDVVSRGTSLVDAVEAIRAEGGDPVLAVAVVDRGGSATRLLGEVGVPFRPLRSAPDLGLPFEGGQPPE